MKKTILILCLLFGFASTSYAGFWDFLFGADTPVGVSLRTFISSQVGSSPTNGDVLQTDGSKSTWVAPSTLGIGGGTGSNWQYETNFGADALTPTSTIPVWFKDKVHATSTIEADGSITTNTGFYGDYWLSSTGNSMAIQPTGDTDDFFSFKTPANRPTIKREGGKYIYVESSNVNDVGISFRKDADHSGTVNYYKDENLFGMTSKDPLVFKVCGDYDDYVKICSANNIPELSVASSSGFKINAGGTNSLLLNHDGGKVGIGTTTVPQELSIMGDIELENTSSDDTGVIYKDGTRFIHNFRHPTGNLARPSGNNLFIGEGSGNFSVGSTADQTWWGSNNVGIGKGTFEDLTRGYNNVAVGAYTLKNVTTGSNNMGIGDGALEAITTAGNNSAIGYYSLKYVTGGANVAFGSNAGKGVSGSSNITQNVLIGQGAGQILETGGNYNVLVGYNAGNNSTTGDRNIIIGYDIDVLTATTDDYLSIGNLIFGTGIDGTGTTVSSGNIGIGTSDPDTLLHLSSTASTTAYYESSGAGFGGRTIYEDTDASGCSEQYTLDGLLFVQTIACP